MKWAKLGTIASALSIVVVTPLLNAERMMIIFEEEAKINQVQKYLHFKKEAVNFSGSKKNEWASLSIQEPLKHIKGLIVEHDNPELLAGLAKLPGVVTIEKEIFYPAPKPVKGYRLTQPWDMNLAYQVQNFLTNQPEELGTKTPYGIHLVKAPQAWAKSRKGAGVRVLVLDTGIDRDHPALSKNYEKGRDFVNDENSPYPEADKVGHGSHVAGTIAASFAADGFVGVAPEARILMGRVCNQGCSNFAVASGINWGIEEKVDVISMSLGGPFATKAERMAIQAAEANGVTVVAATGNDGKGKVSFPAAFPTVLAVGASDSKPAKADFSNWGPELDIMAPGVGVLSSVPMGSGKESQVAVYVQGEVTNVPSATFVGSPDVPKALELELVYAGLGKPEDYKNLSLNGKFALVERGEISFGDKARNAIAVGARGVIIFNNTSGLIQGSVTQDGSILSIPVVMITQKVGQQIKFLIEQEYRPTLSLQTVRTDYAEFDGTSMATPHVAGVVALVKAANPQVTPARIRDVIKATAVKMDTPVVNGVGAGFVDAAAAVEEIMK